RMIWGDCRLRHLDPLMIVCDEFVLIANVRERTLEWSVHTDLPGGTRLIVDISRHYNNTRGDLCLWNLWNDAIILWTTGPGDLNGGTGSLNIDDGDAHGLANFSELLGPYSSGTVNLVGAEIYVQATIGARQPLKAFGKNNCNLAGNMVSVAG